MVASNFPLEMRRVALLIFLLAAALVVAPAQAGDAPVTSVQTPIPTAVTDADVFIVGDSLTVASAPYFDKHLGGRGWRASVDAFYGRTFNEGIEVLRRNKDRLPPTVVVALGTNDIHAPEWAFEWWVGVVRHTVGAKRLVFVNLYIDEKNPSLAQHYRKLNLALARSAQIHGAEVADWATYVTHNRVETDWDGVHYPPGASEQRADFYGAALSPVRTAQR